MALWILALFLLGVSWRKWNHPLVDFGRELNIPWRLSQGAVLYRDVDDVYGPLSQYFNAGLFRVFGPGLIVLAVANLVVLSAILILCYNLFRRAWGATGAWAACGVFISLFAFNQSFYLANFNYVTPYAHEATHGVLVCLALVAAVGKWLEAPGGGWSFAVGVLAGLTLVLKPEFILAAVAVMAMAGLIRWRRDSRKISVTELLLCGLGAIFPSAVFFAYFAFHMPTVDAAIAAGRAWTSLLVHSDIVGLKYQLTFMGLDQPWSNLALQARKSLLALGVLVGFGYVTSRALKLSGWPRMGGLAALTGAALTVGFVFRTDQIGSCLLPLMLLYLGLGAGGLIRRLAGKESSPGGNEPWRILLAVLAAALMARMFLSGRIVQFGFFQAALATMVLAAIVTSESSEWMPLTPWRRWVVALMAAALAVPGIVRTIGVSQHFQALQTFSVGTGRDQFWYYPPEIDATGFVVNTVVEKLKELPRDYTLFTLPEGSMINYLSRRPSPLPQFQFYGFTTENGRELEVVKALQARPPDLVVIASRDLRDFGVSKYGERDGAGRQIMRWIAERYEVTHQIDNDPLDSAQCGAYIMQRKNTAPPVR